MFFIKKLLASSSSQPLALAPNHLHQRTTSYDHVPVYKFQVQVTKEGAQRSAPSPNECLNVHSLRLIVISYET